MSYNIRKRKNVQMLYLFGLREAAQKREKQF